MKGKEAPTVPIPRLLKILGPRLATMSDEQMTEGVVVTKAILAQRSVESTQVRTDAEDGDPVEVAAALTNLAKVCTDTREGKPVTKCGQASLDSAPEQTGGVVICAHAGCGAVLDVKVGPGRRAKYCSAKCRMAAHRVGRGTA